MIEITNVSKRFHSGFIKTTSTNAVNRVSLTLNRGKTTGLVGNSGCGKTTLSRMLLGSIRPDEGQILFEGRNIGAFGRREWKQYRRFVQIIFQNPEESLNPSQRIRDSLLEPMKIQKRYDSARKRMEKVSEVMELVGVPDNLLDRYPHQISGGEAQRLVLCRALTLDPRLLILDEPTSMLDVSVQAHIMNILKRLQGELGLTYLFITHDLELVSWMSDSLAVMNQGRIVEQGETEQVLKHPKDPYTKELASAFLCWDDEPLGGSAD